MIVWHGVEDIPADLEASVVTIGVFDGVHRGHQALIDEAVRVSRDKGLPCVLVTFDPHPLAIFAPDRSPVLLVPVEQRLRHAMELGVNGVLVVDFRRDLAGLSPEEYFTHLLRDKLRAKAVVVGENFTFGRDAAGTSDTMLELGEKYDIDINIVDLLYDEETRICSSNIREYLGDSDVESAAWALGRDFIVTGPIVHGAGRGGRELGFPTANQYFPESMALPADGVYAGWFTIRDDRPIDGNMERDVPYPAAISVGTNPTFGNEPRSVESYLIGREADLYGHTADVSFVGHVRDMVKFNSVDELTAAITADVEKVREILGINEQE
ncbi:bifunctional riboflavin kinase/FAD synthetase [Corynebacterium sp. YIM 101645]|uniref:Riboflavin biosynthesis protein n=1 Tax=Corynebacterium lemuris TaxID=1859292 RepID=A0ABT2FVD7_9CORY|nr:bifunctional riboflavin kinase/FAD synthetase [Corynebacterium lemuris]